MDEALLKHKVYDRKEETLIDLLSDNSESKETLKLYSKGRYGKDIKALNIFGQSFESAWKSFEAISQHTVNVVVPFEEGCDIITELYALPNPYRLMELLKEAQYYSIGLYKKSLDALLSEKIIEKVPLEKDIDIYTLDKEYYDEIIGLIDKEEVMSIADM
jgi:CRISPR-associated endonuclease/helicase Cas3